MFRSYLKIALRNLQRGPVYTGINLAGLAIGVASCLVIALYVFDELSYDRYHDKADRVYRVVNERHAEGEISHRALTPPAYAPSLKQEFPEVLEAVRFFDLGRVLMQRGETKMFEPKAYLTDSTVFKVFSLPLKSGNPTIALAQPNSLVLSESIAMKYFGDEDPIGKTVELNGGPWTVTGVMFDTPRQSHLDLHILGSFSTLYHVQTAERMTSWVWQQFFTYVLLPEGVDARHLEAKLPGFIDQFADPNTTASGFTYEAHLQALTDIHLRSGYLQFDWGNRGNILYVYTFSGIALFVLLIACFNFMNLSTARATQRAKEVGMRKVIGARRVQLIVQFLGESTLMAFSALLLALIITQVALPFFNEFTGKDLEIAYMSGWVVPSLVLLSVVLGFVAGSYPALYLSSFHPIHVLKGSAVGAGAGLTNLRRALVVTQFIITIGLIITTIIVYRQLQFVRTADLGFQRDLIVKLELVEDMASNVEAIKAEFLRHPSIASVTASWGTPGGFTAGDGIRVPGRDTEYGIRVITTDFDFVDTYRMRIAGGRAFSREHPSDEHEAFLLNEAAARALGWTSDEAIGKEISWNRWATDGTKQGPVIGVVEDFHYSSLRQAVEPVVLTIHPSYGHLSVRVNPGEMAAALEAFESEWKKWAPSWPLAYTFLEEELAAQYQSEEKLARICAIFAGLAILIACLGLFGLASFIVERRTKEIGIRKVMGASVKRLVLLLTRDFALLVLVAFAVAVPLAYLTAREWLDGFAYRVDVEPFVFVAAGTVSLAIAVATVGFHTIRAATSDPVKSLRYE